MAKNNPHNPDELIAIVDGSDNIVGNGRRQEIHLKRLIHREVGVFIRNSNDEILLQTRSDTKKFDPAAGGHFPYYQSYRDGAARELEEELGIKINSKELTEMFIERFTVNSPKYGVHDKFIGIFELKEDISVEEITFDPDEVLKVEFFTISKLEKMLKDEKEKFEEDTFQTLPLYLSLIKSLDE